MVTYYRAGETFILDNLKRIVYDIVGTPNEMHLKYFALTYDIVFTSIVKTVTLNSYTF